MLQAPVKMASLPPFHLTMTEDELRFFDRAKEYIGDEDKYADFMKTINLFSTDEIDVFTLFDRVKALLEGHAELWEWFTDFVGVEYVYLDGYHPEKVAGSKRKRSGDGENEEEEAESETPVRKLRDRKQKAAAPQKDE